jgi:hypothetical protein
LTLDSEHHGALAVRTAMRHGIRHALQKFLVERALETDDAAHLR